MPHKGPRTLLKAVLQAHPDLTDPEDVIREGRVTVDGAVVQNPGSMIGPGAHVGVAAPLTLRGELKLGPALDQFGVDVSGRIALDVGASTGGFTRTLLQRGAARVYAVDAGHGQLLGSLRQDPRVVNLENTNIGSLTRALVPDPVETISLDLSYISLTAAVPQLHSIVLAPGVQMIALVKPMFELHLPQPPEDRPRLEEALRLAVAGIEAAGWRVRASMESPVRGSRGAFEWVVHAARPLQGEGT